MRFLAWFIAGTMALGFAGYLYLRQMGLDTKGTTISQSIALAFVRRNMFRIADAEREQSTAYSECFSVYQLISTEKSIQAIRNAAITRFLLCATAAVRISL